MAAVKSVCVAAIVVLSLLASLEASPVSVSGGTSDNLRIKLRRSVEVCIIYTRIRIQGVVSNLNVVGPPGPARACRASLLGHMSMQ